MHHEGVQTGNACRRSKGGAPSHRGGEGVWQTGWWIREEQGRGEGEARLLWEVEDFCWASAVVAGWALMGSLVFRWAVGL